MASSHIREKRTPARFERNFREFSSSLTDSEDFDKRDEYKALKEQYKGIFSERSKVMTEMACYGMMDKLFTRYSRLARNLCDASDCTSLSSGDAKLAELTWGRRYTEDAIQDHHGEIMWWLHAVTDHIVGMTDDYAQKMSSLF